MLGDTYGTYSIKGMRLKISGRNDLIYRAAPEAAALVQVMRGRTASGNSRCGRAQTTLASCVPNNVLARISGLQSSLSPEKKD